MNTIEKLTASKNDLKKAALVIRSVNHKLRVQMLLIINEVGEITVTDLYVKMRLEQSVCSQHLAVLRRSGIVKTRRDGKHIIYSVSYETLDRVIDTAKSLVSGGIK